MELKAIFAKGHALNTLVHSVTVSSARQKNSMIKFCIYGNCKILRLLFHAKSQTGLPRYVKKKTN